MKQQIPTKRLWIASLIIAALVLAAWATQAYRNIWRQSPPTSHFSTNWKPDAPPVEWKWIVIHHSASKSGDASIFDAYHRIEKGWDELGYHFVINNGEPQPDGLIEVGGRWTSQKHGAHAKDSSGQYNEFGIGICLVGDFDQIYPTAAQWVSLLELCTHLCNEYRISPDAILGHNHVTPGTHCPGSHFDLTRLRDEVALRINR